MIGSTTSLMSSSLPDNYAKEIFGRRDVFVATQHAMVAPRMFETVGRIRLSLNTDTTRL